ncbi:MAG: trimethylamine methyltransferase family protein, partial [Clostridiales bacterium]
MYIGKQYYPQEQNYETLNQQQREQIHSAALRLLWEHGMMLNHPEALEMVKKAGAVVKDNNMVHFPASLVEWAVRQAPSRVTLFDRDGKPAMFLERKNVYYGTGSDTVVLTDYQTKNSEPWTKAQVCDAVKLCDALENIDFVMSMGLISDVHYTVNTREQYAAMIRNTTKPHLVVCDGKEDLEDVFQMYVAVRGNKEELRLKPYAAVYNEPTSPMVNSHSAIDKLMLCADYGVPSNYATGSMSGATTPMTAAGTIALSTAECLCGLVIHQLRQPGAPFVFGFG